MKKELNLPALLLFVFIFLLFTEKIFAHGTSNLEGHLSFSTSNAKQGDTVQLILDLNEIEAGALADIKNICIKIDTYNNDQYADMSLIKAGQYALPIVLKEGKFNLRVWLQREEKNEIGMNGFTVTNDGLLFSENESELWFVPKGEKEPIIWLDNLSGIAIGVLGLFALLFLFGKGKNLFTESKNKKSNFLLYLATIAAVSMPFGAYWDVSFHAESGRESFFQAPHLLIYGGILICMFIIAIGLGKKEKGLSWMQHIKKDKAIMVALLAMLFQLTSGPFDEIWHNTFGLDVSIWSPPHIILIFGGVAVCIALSMITVKTENFTTALFRSLTLAGALLIVEVFLAEFEFPLPSWHISQSRPYWAYIVLLTLFSLIMIMIAKIRIRSKWAATITMSIFLLLRLVMYPFLDLVGRPIQPAFPYWIIGFVLLGLLVDLVYKNYSYKTQNA
jgi:hypothetical protein